MGTVINALSMTSRVKSWLTGSNSPRILHVFDRVCNLINERGEVISVVTPEIGAGPFNLVIESDINFAAQLTSKSRIRNQASQLQLGEISIRLETAQLWNPAPSWESLHSQKNKVAKQVQQLPITNYPIPQPPIRATNALINPTLQSSHSLSSSIATANLPACINAAQRLAGLGEGLTPSGDDFMLGALYAAWIIHSPETARHIAAKIAEVAAPLTTSLSAAWLRAAATGEAGILWHKFFDALLSEDPSAILVQVSNILSIGATSGADAMAGFIDTFIALTETKNRHVIP